MLRPVQFVRSRARLLFGSAVARRSRLETHRQSRNRAAGVAQFLALAGPVPDDGEAPVFLLSAGWGSGSTLLQRLLSSGDNVLIWGEAYDRSTIVQHMADSLAPFSAEWPPSDYMKPPQIEDISQTWAANLYPPPQALLEAYRTTLLKLFADPAYALGAKRWGFKEVRFGHAEALLLKGLFPDARFLFIRRQLEDTYLSYKHFNSAMNWYGRWPFATAFTPYSYARHWAELNGELDRAVSDTGGILVTYEDLVAGRSDLAQIEAYVGFPLRREVLEKRIGSGDRRNASVSSFERLLLRAGRRAGETRARERAPTGPAGQQGAIKGSGDRFPD